MSVLPSWLAGSKVTEIVLANDGILSLRRKLEAMADINSYIHGDHTAFGSEG